MSSAMVPSHLAELLCRVGVVGVAVYLGGTGALWVWARRVRVSAPDAPAAQPDYFRCGGLPNVLTAVGLLGAALALIGGVWRARHTGEHEVLMSATVIGALIWLALMFTIGPWSRRGRR